ncbi:sulfite exporter TauE/SafE family protein [Paraburkholderia sp. BL9I2N2]|uniref:sulfite exporter TauE/SafE family protein n=1 Tax=Paraburkholderia sp. BL9I2N2 TaxID=1938809 RepID=UPI001052C38F|nr:sulfite exporter TauE/SafE family protein [Paraburkholderia sp. BL9I2N2]TCK84360.1 hypothetical protein B0G74_9209 [Paraburkholderia sp. BL9I2N2]
MTAAGMMAQGLAAALCGSFVSFSLGLLGGGGSILAVPLILYVVGLHNPHVAIGTAALAVAASAYINIIPHARAGRVRWGAALTFAGSGVLGAALGSSIGKLVDGHVLTVYFALLMCVVAFLTQRARPAEQAADGKLPAEYVRLCGTGLGAGGVSGFFGIGGGFLVVPGLMYAGRMQIVDAIGTSLFAVGSFGMTTAINYAMSGQVDWLVAVEFVGGGVIGGAFGARAAGRLAHRRSVLNRMFAMMIVAVAAYMLYQACRT